MWFGGLGSLAQKLRKRATQRECPRCSMLFATSADECPYCHHVPELQLRRALRTRQAFRLGLGRLMLLAALVLLVLTLVLTGFGTGR